MIHSRDKQSVIVLVATHVWLSTMHCQRNLSLHNITDFAAHRIVWYIVPGDGHSVSRLSLPISRCNFYCGVEFLSVIQQNTDISRTEGLQWPGKWQFRTSLNLLHHWYHYTHLLIWSKLLSTSDFCSLTVIITRFLSSMKYTCTQHNNTTQ